MKPSQVETTTFVATETDTACSELLWSYNPFRQFMKQSLKEDLQTTLQSLN